MSKRIHHPVKNASGAASFSAKTLAFYLDRKDAYLLEMARIGTLREKMGP